MSELSFEQLLEGSLKKIRTGEVVTGKVFDVKPEEIIVDIGYKSDGIIPKNEYTNDSSVDLTDLVKVGDAIEAKVVKVNDGEGQVVLSTRKLQAERGSKMLEEAFENKTVLSAKVAQIMSGGLSVMVDGVRVFIPISQISDTYEKDLEKYKDAEIEFELIEYNPKKRRVIGSRKQLLLARKAEMQKELFERIEIGQTVEGTVKNVTEFGAFIDLGGADGLLHISEMSWGRVENPKKVFHTGDQVRAFIKDINGDKIALSIKFPETNPWADADEKYAVGNIVNGRVARMTDFGAFVELEPGIDALLHVSQIAREHVEKPSDFLKIGQYIDAKVVDFNGEDKKISLSMKALENYAPVENETVYSDPEEYYPEDEAPVEE
ncbi:MAG: 30S ribosomal protein S1 [Lachnospiraceae bacterium]|jgi:ribosomal protein S1|nr:30S ribosomal protein S1 [Lachnospiraceae bacterium]